MTTSEKIVHRKKLAVINESHCIGCTKCIDACPVDAILGASKQMHVVLISECIGCELCVPACPVDCINIIPEKACSPEGAKPASYWRDRASHRKKRLANLEENTFTATTPLSFEDKQSFVKNAMARVKNKKDC